MMTSLNDINSINKAYEIGATDFIIKPLNPALLLYRIRYALRATQTAAELRESQARLQAAQRTAKLGYWQWDSATDQVEWSEEINNLFGLQGVSPPLSSPGHVAKTRYSDFLDFFHPEDRQRVDMAIFQARRGDKTYRIDHRVIGRDGQERYVHQEGEWQDKHRLNGILQDITRLRRAEQRIHQLAYYDSVTGLPNRAHLYENLRETLARARRYQQQVAVLFLDLDKFKSVNDQLGHSAGDLLLKQVAARLLECVRSQDAVVRASVPSDEQAVSDDKQNNDAVVRLGGDEFVILAGDIRQPGDAARLSERIIAKLTPPFHLTASDDIVITTSIGIALYPEHGDNLDTLLTHADHAMYQAKQNGRGRYQFFSHVDDGSANSSTSSSRQQG